MQHFFMTVSEGEFHINSVYHVVSSSSLHALIRFVRIYEREFLWLLCGLIYSKENHKVSYS